MKWYLLLLKMMMMWFSLRCLCISYNIYVIEFVACCDVLVSVSLKKWRSLMMLGLFQLIRVPVSYPTRHGYEYGGCVGSFKFQPDTSPFFFSFSFSFLFLLSINLAPLPRGFPFCSFFLFFSFLFFPPFFPFWIDGLRFCLNKLFLERCLYKMKMCSI